MSVSASLVVYILTFNFVIHLRSPLCQMRKLRLEERLIMKVMRLSLEAGEVNLNSAKSGSRTLGVQNRHTHTV